MKPAHILAAALAGAALALAPAAWAQSDGEEPPVEALEDAELGAGRLTREDAARVLAEPLPAEPEARFALLVRQYRAALLLDQRARVVDSSRGLAEMARGRPGADQWVRRYLNAEFTWGSQGRANEAGEAFLADRGLSPEARAQVALRLAYFAAQGRDRAVLMRLWSRADGLAREVMQANAGGPTRLALDHLHVRAEVEGHSGELAAAVATLRQAVGLSRRHLDDLGRRGVATGSPEMADGIGWLDGSQGMLVYALVRLGRQMEAIEIARTNLALWKAGRLSDSLGARWQYRLATALVASQQYEPGLAAARESDEMLGRFGADPASHTRRLARQEIVRALIGLRRWAEGDEAYRRLLADMGSDAVARDRASDNRLLALLAAKNGRLEEALETAERLHRFRLRLFGASHPSTQEAAGVRAVVRLRRGETSAALADYESLFTAALDNPGSWTDLEGRGLRGFVLGIAFDEFMQHLAERTRRGERVDDDLASRALQVADRMSLSTTQRAITDSTARVLAATPALKAMIEREQALRQAAGQGFARLNAALTDEDRLRRETQTEAFKARPDAERKAHVERIREQRERVKQLQAEAASGRAQLEAHRQAIAQQHPAYADLVSPATPRIDTLRRLLQPGEALLVVHPGELATLLWVVPADGRPTFAVSALTAAQLATRVAAVRRMLDVGEVPAAQRPPLDLAALHALYKDLLGPVEGALRETRSLVVAAGGPLAGLPLSVLVTDAPSAGAPPAWLLRRMAVTQLPSPAALQALRRVAQPPLAPRPLIGFGDPQFDPGPRPGAAPAAGSGRSLVVAGKPATRYDAEWGFRYADIPPLPETRTELTAVAQALGADPAADLLLGPRATRAAVLSTPMADRRVVAFATHGLMPGEHPGISKPSLAMAATGEEGESPLLELDDVLTLRLNAQWVLLSACNTAAGEQGGAAMSGLVRGFFFAGARSVLATHWAVETASAAQLSTQTFRRHAQGGVSRADSLRQAQLALIDGSLGGGRWGHPFYWAPYALFGDPAR